MNVEEHRSYCRSWYRENKDGVLERNFKNKYGITYEERDALLAKQKGLCAICGADAPGGRWGSWHTDHCHETNKVRGMLCDACNRGLGFFKDNPAFLTSAVKYLGKDLS
jgi:Recombination endonuclease VII